MFQRFGAFTVELGGRFLDETKTADVFGKR